MTKTHVSILTILAFSVAALCSASPALAFSITGNTTAVSVPDTLGGIGHNVDQYQITLNSDSAAFVQAFDLTVTGTLAQAQNFTFGSGVPSPLLADVQPFGAGAVAQDSHFVVPLILPGTPIPPPTEGVIPGLTMPNSGFGMDLVSNQVAIAGTSQSPSVLALQVVLDPGTTALLTGTIAIQGNPNPVDIGQIVIGDPNGGGDPNGPANTPPVVNDQDLLCTDTNPCVGIQLAAMDAEDGNDGNLDWSWTGLTGPGVPVNTPTLSSSGVFDWDPTGSANGFYTSTLTVEDSGMLMDTATLTVQVPEPGTLVLAGLSLVGIFANRRRDQRALS